MTRPVVGLVLVAAVAVAGLVADALWRPAPAAAPAPVPQPPASSGTWYCPATSGPEEQATVSVAAVGDEPSVVTVVRYADGATTDDAPVQVAPGDQLDVSLGPGEANRPVAVRWRQGPAAVAWRGEGADPAAGPCEPAPAPRWYVTGFETNRGSTSRLHLFNPFTEAAVARLVFGTPEGREALVIAESIVVPAATATVVDLAEFEPEIADLAVTVEVRSGRLVAQGEVALDPPGDQPGPRGRALLPGVPEPRLEWAWAFSRADDASQSWLSVYNPHDREAAVEIRVSDPLPDSTTLLGEQSVPAGGVLRIDLAGASAQPEFAVGVVGVNDAPVVVARVSALRNNRGQGLAATRGGQPATEWAVVGAGTAQRRSRLAVYNPGGEPVTVDLVAPGAPAEWQGIEIGPNARVVVDYETVGEDIASLPVVVRATGPVVPEVRVLGPGGGLGLWTATGSPEGAWSGPDHRPPVLRDPLLSRVPMPAD